MNLSDWLMMRRESPSPGPSQRRTSVMEELTGIGNEIIITLVLARMNWDIQALCCLASVSRRLRELARRILWREVCLQRAPVMTRALTHDGDWVLGGWHALAKLMFYCGGCQPMSTHMQLSHPLPGHFVGLSRFSIASGLNLLSWTCLADDLYLSEAMCVHPNPGEQGEWRNFLVGLYRGVFRSFVTSRTREALIQRNMGFVAEVRCPFCKARVWSMTAAGLVPWERAASWLSTRGARLEYYVCFNGHLHGACWLLSLEQFLGEISDEANTDEDSFIASGGDDDDDDDNDNDDGDGDDMAKFNGEE